MQDVVLVGGDHQPVDRQPHALRHPAGEDVAEVAGRHREAHRPVRGAESDRRREVVDGLRQHPGPVDRVHPGEAHPVAEGMVVEQILHPRLGVVEVAGHGEGMHVRLRRRRHLPALDIGDPPVREQDEDLDALPAAKGLDRRRAGVAAGRADDGHPPAASGGGSPRRAAPISCIATSLKASVGPWKSSSNQSFGADLHQGHPRGMVEAGIGADDDLRGARPHRRRRRRTGASPGSATSS